jgi:hypothetical protein
VAFPATTKGRKGFGGPMALKIVGIIGMPRITLGAVLVLVTILSAIGCAASGAASSCGSLSQSVGGVLAVLGGALLAFVGWIGLLIGVYRIGNRHHSTLTRVGAFLYILPMLSVVAPIRVFLGIPGILMSLETGGAARPRSRVPDAGRLETRLAEALRPDVRPGPTRGSRSGIRDVSGIGCVPFRHSPSRSRSAASLVPAKAISPVLRSPRVLLVRFAARTTR